MDFQKENTEVGDSDSGGVNGVCLCACGMYVCACMWRACVCTLTTY